MSEDLVRAEAEQSSSSVNKVRELLEVTEKGEVRSTLQNCTIILQNDETFKGAIRFNTLTERVDIVKEMGWQRTRRNLTDTDIKYILLYMERHYGICNEKKITDSISIVANENRYHPICEYLNGLEWDGKERIRYCLNHFLGADVNEYTHEVMKVFLLGAISRVFNAGCKFEYMLCLVGGQGAGKSTFFRFLAFFDEWFTDDLKKLDDENVYRRLQGHWIIEMAEMLAIANAKSIETMKEFISKQSDNYKVPYETQPQDRPRQCVFGGTSNTMDFLPLDRTGNRRFLPVLVNAERIEKHILEDERASKEYISQVWAEAMAIFRSGNFKLTLSKDMTEYLTEYQRNFMPEDTKVGTIQSYLDEFKGDIVCSKQIYRDGLQRYDEPKQWEIREINDIMNNSIVGWIPFSNPRYFKDYGRQKGWERERLTTKSDNGLKKTFETGEQLSFDTSRNSALDEPFPFD